MRGIGGAQFTFGAVFLGLMVLLSGGTALPFIIAGLFFLYRWGKDKEKPTPRRPMPEPAPKERTTDFSYGASDGSLGFEVPPLAGAPKSAGSSVYQETSARKTSIREPRFPQEKARQSRLSAQRGTGAGTPAAPRGAAPRFTPAALADAVILAEILAPPKALRRHRGG